MGSETIKKRTASESEATRKDTGSRTHHFRKYPVKTVIALAVDSLLVLSAAAIGGVSYYKSNNGTGARQPRRTTIGTSAQNEDVLLTLHESVSDDYTTAYIFSVQSLTDAGKSLLNANTFDPDACRAVFEPADAEEPALETLANTEPAAIADEKTPLAQNIDSRSYTLEILSPSGDSVELNIGLRRKGLIDDAENSAVFAIRPIAAKGEENREFYSLDIICDAPQQLSLTFDGLEIPLSKATARNSGIEIGIGGCLRDYFQTEGKSAQTTSDYPDDAVLTPLGLYVNGGNQAAFFYDHAKLVFNDGSEVGLNRLSQAEKEYCPSFFADADDSLSVFLFKDLVDNSSLKSLVFFDEVEIPTDGGTPFVRSTGRKLKTSSDTDVVWTGVQRLRDYIAEVCPVPVGVQGSASENAWSNVKYGGKDTLCFDVVSDLDADKADRFFISYTEISGLALEQEARAMIEKCNTEQRAAGISRTLSFKIIKTGKLVGNQLIAVDCGETAPGYTKRCIFAIYGNRLVTVQYDSFKDGAAYQAFDELLKLF